MLSSVVLFATARAALTWEDTTLAARLAAQLESLGAERITVLARPADADALRPTLGARVHESPDATADLEFVAAAAREHPAGALAFARADILTQREALAGVLLDPRPQTTVLTSRRLFGRVHATNIRTSGNRVVAAASPYHRVEHPDSLALGVVRVADSDRAALADVAERLAGEALLLPAAERNPPAVLLVGLVRSGLDVRPSSLRRLYWSRPADQDAVQRAQDHIRDFDEEAALLGSSVKLTDGFFATFFVSPYSRYIARWFARRGWTPNAVTFLSLAVGTAAAAAFADGARGWLIAGALLLQAAFTLDCVDGQLARYTRTFTPSGAYLDSTFDRVKEYVVYAGLAIGSSEWTLAACALALQTTRHMLDYGIPYARQTAVSRTAVMSLKQHADTGQSPPLERVNAWTWVKRIAGFPIGERFLVISVTAAIADAQATFVVLLAGTAVGIGYLLLGTVKWTG
jgi:hypothetical protein